MEAPSAATRRSEAAGARPYLWMLVASSSFACMGAFSKAAEARCDWRLIALARAGVMLVFAVLLARLQRVPLLFLRPAALWWRSFAGSLALLSTFYAYTHLPLSDATSLIYMTPVWVVLLSWPLLGERPRLALLGAVAVSIGGVLLVARPHFAKADLGVASGLASSGVTAVAMMSLHRLGAVDPRAVVVHFSLVATVVSGGIFLAGTTDLSRAGRADVFYLVALGAAGTVGQIALTRAYAAGNPSRVSLVAISQIVFTVLIEAVLWNRTYDARTLAGMALIAMPTAWILVRKSRKD
jgi:drug/metabolite transporter (DMT)-like permease